MSFVEHPFEGELAVVCRTGYTGERGYELIIANAAAGALWDAIMAAGAEFDIAPAGLGLYKELSDTVDGLFLGRSAHDPRAFAEVLDEMLSVSRHAEVNAERASETPRKQHP